MGIYHTEPGPVELVPGTQSARWLEAAPHGRPLSEQEMVLQATQARLDRRRLLLGIEPRLGRGGAA